MSVKKIAIIGAGAAGATAAYRLRHLLGSDAEITVYEKEIRPGGRAATVDFAGTAIEVGGTLLNSSGERIAELADFVGAERVTPDVEMDGGLDTLGFWNGAEFTMTPRNDFKSLAWTIIRRFGVLSAWRLREQAKALSGGWGSIYGLQDAGALYENPLDMAAAVGLDKIAQKTLGKYLHEGKVSVKLIKELAEPVVRNMYNQEATINAFAGEIGLAGAGLAGGYMYSIKGGIWSLYDRVAQAVASVREPAKVERIEASGGVTDRVFTVIDSAGGKDRYDAVVLATPLELADVELVDNGAAVEVPRRPYQEVNVTLVVGRLSHEYFHQASSFRLPSTIFTEDIEGLRFKSVGITGHSPQHDERIYKVFSAERRFDDSDVAELFSDVQDVHRLTWPGAYPVLKPSNPWPSFEPVPGLFYANAFETAASTMEIDAVAAWNVAGLAARYLG